MAVAGIIANNSMAAALTFNDAKSAREILDALKAERHTFAWRSSGRPRLNHWRAINVLIGSGRRVLPTAASGGEFTQ